MASLSSKTTLTATRAILSVAIEVSDSTARRIGFWTAITLPLVYIPLVLIGHAWVIDAPNFMKVIGLHIVSIIIGMDHGSG